MICLSSSLYLKDHTQTKRPESGTSKQNKSKKIWVSSMERWFSFQESAKICSNMRFLKLPPRLVNQLVERLPYASTKYLNLKELHLNWLWVRLLHLEDLIWLVSLPKIYLRAGVWFTIVLNTSLMRKTSKIFLVKKIIKNLCQTFVTHKLTPSREQHKINSRKFLGHTEETELTLAKVGSLCPQSASKHKNTKIKNYFYLRSVPYFNKSKAQRLLSQNVKSQLIVMIIIWLLNL